MNSGFLREYFTGVACKHLSPVETDASVSNQHEYNGVSLLKHMFGTDVQKQELPTNFLYVADEDEVFEATGSLTWYDARYNHPTRTEWRLYYPENEVTSRAAAGDTLFICLKPDHTVFVIIARRDSLIENQLFWLFNIHPDEDGHSFITNMDLTNANAAGVGIVARMILQKLGIEMRSETEDYTDFLVEKFGRKFPSSREFSGLARTLVGSVDPVEDPDGTLMRWYEQEEALFRCLERVVVEDRLRLGFVTDGFVDVDAFISYSLSVQNRRKSRAGLSLENHIMALLDMNNITYSHTPKTEAQSRPDFIFPSILLYHNESFPAKYLTMLGAKTSAKDRWRQVLEEADRISHKHLITIEGAISENQTSQMARRNLQLVVPQAVFPTYTEAQQEWLFNVSDFLTLVRDRQRFSEAFHG